MPLPPALEGAAVKADIGRARVGGARQARTGHAGAAAGLPPKRINDLYDLMKNELAAVKVAVTVAATSEKMAEMVVGQKLVDVNEKLQAYETFP